MGKLTREWYESFEGLPVERLRFEYDKRQPKIRALQLEAEEFSRRLLEMKGLERVRGGRVQEEFERLSHLMGVVETQAMDLQQEADAIDEIIGRKWR